MSELKVEVVKIDEIKVHPNADALEIAIVRGWQTVVRKGEFKAGDDVVYFPLDSVLPEKLSNAIGVTKYLHRGRIVAAKLRGEASYGLIWAIDNAINYIALNEFSDDNGNLKTNGILFGIFLPGLDLTERLGVTKWEPPPIFDNEETENPHVLFEKYTNIQNMRNYPNIILEGEDVIITEKLHGMNSRFAYIDGQFMAGSHTIRKKENVKSRWWSVFSDNMKELLRTLSNENEKRPIIMFGEIFGWIQDLHYGFKQGTFGYRCFDIRVGSKYMDYPKFIVTCAFFNVDTVPILYRGPFSMSEVMKYSNSRSQIDGSDNIMEGVVIKPVNERFDSNIGRVILKYVFDQYLTRHGGTEFK